MRLRAIPCCAPAVRLEPDDRERSGDGEQADGCGGTDPNPPRLEEDELGEPLLVDPVMARRHHGQMVEVRQPVLGDLASGHEREPEILGHECR